MSIQNFNIFGTDIPVEDAELKRLIGKEKLVTEAQTISSAINEVYNLVTNIRDEVGSVYYPVGSIYMSVLSTSPATLFGGTWVQIKDTFLLCAGGKYSAGSTGGSADAKVISHSHDIPSLNGITNEAGSHDHNIRTRTGIASGESGFLAVGGVTYDGRSPTPIEDGGSHQHTVTIDASTTGETGEDSIGANMPPYLAVYVWKRTA